MHGLGRNSRSSHSHTAVKSEDPYSASTSSRPIRGARLAAAQSISAYNEDDSIDGEDDGDLTDTVGAVHPVYSTGFSTRSGRAVKPPEKYKGENDFENRMVETSPVLRDMPRRGGRLRRRVVHPDDDDEDEDDDDAAATFRRPPRRNAFPMRVTRNSLGSNHAAGQSHTNGKVVNVVDPRGKSAKSRHSSEDADSFSPNGSETGEDVSEDPLNRAFDEDDEVETPEASPRLRRTTRSSAREGVRRSTRQTARAIQDSDNDYARPKRQLRQRTSKVNYELPPLDISAEIVQDAIAGAARPGGRGIRYRAQTGGKGLPWLMKGRDMAQVMGDLDTSDSVLGFLWLGPALFDRLVGYGLCYADARCYSCERYDARTIENWRLEWFNGRAKLREDQPQI